MRDLCSSKAKVTMICGRMQSWNKFSACATWCCVTTKRLGGEISKFVITKFYLSLRKLESSSSSATPSPFKAGCKMRITGDSYLRTFASTLT